MSEVSAENEFQKFEDMFGPKIVTEDVYGLYRCMFGRICLIEWQSFLMRKLEN